MSDSSPSVANLTQQQKRELLKELLAKKAAQVPPQYPLAYGQRAFWFLQEMVPSMASYNIAVTAEATPFLHREAFERAVNAIFTRHPCLRTIFYAKGEELIQEIQEPVARTIPEIDASLFTPEQLSQAVEAECKRPFDIRTSSCRLSLFRTHKSHVLLFTVHHIVFDAWSARIFLSELRGLYEAELKQRTSELPAVSATYREFVQWQLAMLNGTEGEVHWAYWSDQLKGVLPHLTLSGQKKAISLPTYQGASVMLPIDLRVARSLRELLQAHRTTMFAVTLAAFTTLLQRLSGQNEIMVGFPVSGRNRSEWSGIIGDFINMLPLRATFHPGLRFREHLQAISTQVREALTHQDFPFPVMVDRLRLPRRADRTPIFQVILNVHSMRAGQDLTRLLEPNCKEPVTFGDSELRAYTIRQQEGQYELGLEMLDSGNGLLAQLRYSTDTFSNEVGQAIAAEIPRLLAQIAADSNKLIAEYQVIDLNNDLLRDEVSF